MKSSRMIVRRSGDFYILYFSSERSRLLRRDAGELADSVASAMDNR